MEPQTSQRRLAAILAADVVAYTRMMAGDEEGTLATLTAHRQTITGLVAEFGGRMFGAFADSAMVEFPSVVHAVRAAVAVQRAIDRQNTALDDGQRMQFRIGINVGEVLTEGDNLYGDAVNVAARLQDIAGPSEICVSGAAFDHIRARGDFPVERLGERSLKNVADPVIVYRIGWQDQKSQLNEPGLAGLPLPEKPSIAVLPFTNMSGDREQEFFSDGITEDIITGLSKLRGFFVIARNSTFAYKGKATDIRQVARDLGVRYVLEGSVRKAGDRVRVTGQLIDATTGNHVWAERYDRSIEDVFGMQDELVGNVVAAVEPQIYAAERARLQQKAPGSLDAWDCVIRALSHMAQLTRGDNAAALDLLSQALRLDPDYARALGLHAWLSLFNAHMGWGAMSEVAPAATERARAAVSRDRNDSWARLALGCAHMFGRENDNAVDEMRAALDLNPNFAIGFACLGLALAYGGRGTEAVPCLDKAMRLSPRDPFFPMLASARAFSQFMAGDYADGVHWGRRAVSLSPGVSGYWRALALCAAMLGYEEEARSAIARVLRLQPNFSAAWVERESPLMHAADRRRYCDALRPVGLPES